MHFTAVQRGTPLCAFAWVVVRSRLRPFGPVCVLVALLCRRPAARASARLLVRLLCVLLRGRVTMAVTRARLCEA